MEAGGRKLEFQKVEEGVSLGGVEEALLINLISLKDRMKIIDIMDEQGGI